MSANSPVGIVFETPVSRTASAVEKGARVLHFGGASYAPLLELLLARGCHLAVVLEDSPAHRDGLPACEQIVLGSIEDPHIRQQLENDLFDVAIVSDVLLYAEDPIRSLKSLASLLAESGHIVATVPNVAHAPTRLELRAGGLPGYMSVRRARHFYTRELLETLLEACGFCLGRLECVAEPDDAGSSPSTRRLPLDEVLAPLATDDEARATHFVAVAFAVPPSPLSVFKESVPALVRRCELAEQRLQHLTTSADPAAEVVAAERRIAALRDHCGELQATIDALREQLGQLGVESSERAASTARLADRARHGAEARDQLDSFTRLGVDAAAIEREMDDLRDRLRANREQIQVMRESFSWRLTSPIRAIARMFGRTTTDETLRFKP